MASSLVNFLGGMLPQWEKDRIKSGMISPRVRKMSPGTKLFHVADAERAAKGKRSSGSATLEFADVEAGCWWYGQKAFNKMMEYCVQADREKNRGLGYAAREACAILPIWNDCDVLVEAILVKTAPVFYGVGRAQSDGKITLSGWEDIHQWYIPGLTALTTDAQGNRHFKLSPEGQKLVSVYRYCSILSVKGDYTSQRGVRT